ncbi:MAG: FkbM family methyltransferase [Gemmatimonadetes bacterium]|nr:FkbM family methyltransferase [Gemmatimonadota bacterium]
MYTWRAILKELGFRARVKWLEIGFKPYVIKKIVEGLAFDFYVGDVESSIWNDTGEAAADWKEMEFVKDRLVAPGDVVFDCGAHHGLTPLVFSELVGEKGRVVAFEPHPKNVQIINRNVAINGRTNIKVEQYALGMGRSTIRLRDKSNASVAWRPTRKDVIVEVISLDEYAAQAGLYPTFVKIDVEGYEQQVIEGASKVLRKTPKLAIEVHATALSRYGGSFRELLEPLVANGYDFWILREATVEPFHPSSPPPGDSRFHLFAIPHALIEGDRGKNGSRAE